MNTLSNIACPYCEQFSLIPYRKPSGWLGCRCQKCNKVSRVEGFYDPVTKKITVTGVSCMGKTTGQHRKYPGRHRAAVWLPVGMPGVDAQAIVDKFIIDRMENVV